MAQAKTNNEYILHSFIHSFNEYLMQGHYLLDAAGIKRNTK